MESVRLLLFFCLSLSLGGASVGKTLVPSIEEQSTLPKSDLRAKEKSILRKDLSDTEEKLFVGHIPDIEDVGVFHPIPVPALFEAYDVDPVDGKISLSELIKVTGAEENVGDSFYAADKNGDQEISRSEFKKAPWWLEVDNGEVKNDLEEQVVDRDGSPAFIDTTEDRLPNREKLSWSYILNGNLESQQQKNNIADQTIPMLQERDQKSEIKSNGKQMTVDFGDVFGDENKVIMTDEDLKKLNAELLKMR